VKNLFGLVILILVVSPLPAAETGWWNPAWQCRREVVFPETTDATVFEVVFPTHGSVRADGGDVRVVAGGAEVPTKVLSVGPGELAHVVFERKGAGPHFIYWNHPKAPAPRDWTPPAGVLLEVRGYPGEEIKSLKEWRKAWAAGKPRQGLDFVPNIFFGYNPFGDPENILTHFVGHLRCPAAGEYTFATDSDDASFLLIDGKLVTEWPGNHGACGLATHSGRAKLAAGTHVIEYCHAQGGGDMRINAAWAPPGAEDPKVIPPEAFVPLEAAKVKALETPAKALVPDFLPVNAGEAVLNPEGDEYIIRMHFENLADEETLKDWTCRWFFGDGTTSDAPSPDHVYLVPGDYSVTLKMVKGYDEKSATMKVAVARDRGRDAKAIDLRESYYDVVKTYDVSRMDPVYAWRVMYYFERVAKRDDEIAAGKVLLSRENNLDEDTLCRAVGLYAEAMRVVGKDYEGARKMLLDYEKRMKSAEHASALALAAGDIAMWHLKKLDLAEADYRRVIFTYGEKSAKSTLRRALVRMGDIFRWRGDGPRAREFLDRASLIPVDNRDAVQRMVRAGYFARSVEALLAAGDMDFAYETLVQWAWEFPEDLLDGSWTELRVKWLIRNKEYTGGIAEVESLLKMSPKTLYAPTLLWLAADCAEATGDRAGAAKLLERILTDYPEASNKGAAVKRIEELKKPAPPAAAAK
jgi:tetratricopeptide (TPR) repeat protein